MGGLTKIRLKDISQANIDKQNKILDEIGLRKDIRFYSEKDIVKEYEHYLSGDGYYPESLFPKNKINSYEDFKRYWSTEALGETFVPKIGTLKFDCYFGRTSARAMKMIGKYVVDNHEQIRSTSGSWSTFLERAGLSQIDLQIIESSAILQNLN